MTVFTALSISPNEHTAADIFRLADDARVRHAVERLRHLAGDGVERASKHP